MPKTTTTQTNRIAKSNEAIAEAIQSLSDSHRGREVLADLRQFLKGPASGLDLFNQEAVQTLIREFFEGGRRKTIDLSPDAEINRLCGKLEKEICALLKNLKADIGDDYRTSDDPDDTMPGMQITVATRNLEQWNYQTGDNSYTGACYSLPHWGVGSLYRRTNCKELAADLVNQMAEQVAVCGEEMGE